MAIDVLNVLYSDHHRHCAVRWYMELNVINFFCSHLKINIFTAVKYCCIFNGRVCIIIFLLSFSFFPLVHEDQGCVSDKRMCPKY